MKLRADLIELTVRDGSDISVHAFQSPARRQSAMVMTSIQVLRQTRYAD
jgi:hypothetical protein